MLRNRCALVAVAINVPVTRVFFCFPSTHSGNRTCIAFSERFVFGSTTQIKGKGLNYIFVCRFARLAVKLAQESVYLNLALLINLFLAISPHDAFNIFSRDVKVANNPFAFLHYFAINADIPIYELSNPVRTLWVGCGANFARPPCLSTITREQIGKCSPFKSRQLVIIN